MTWIDVKATVTKGHGVASGKAGDPRFPLGTLTMQKPLFRERGLDLSKFHAGTLNLEITPHTYRIKKSKCTFRNVKWSPTEPAEDFSFFDCRIIVPGEQATDGLIYYPHPETKPAHFQPLDVLEVITFYIQGLVYGAKLILEVDDEQIEIYKR